MNELVKILVATTVAGAAIPLGALLASKESIRPRWLETEVRHGIIAMGGGILIGAVALVLVPESLGRLPIWAVLLCFLAGGTAFGALEACLSRRDTPASNLVAMLTDFIPEAIAMGAAFAAGGSAGMALALFMFLQNMPEGFNAYREMMDAGGFTRNRLLLTFVALLPFGADRWNRRILSSWRFPHGHRRATTFRSRWHSLRRLPGHHPAGKTEKALAAHPRGCGWICARLAWRSSDRLKY